MISNSLLSKGHPSYHIAPHQIWQLCSRKMVFRLFSVVSSWCHGDSKGLFSPFHSFATHDYRNLSGAFVILFIFYPSWKGMMFPIDSHVFLPWNSWLNHWVKSIGFFCVWCEVQCCLTPWGSFALFLGLPGQAEIGNWVAGEISDVPGRIDACNRIRYTVFGQTCAGRNEHIDMSDMLQAILVQLADSLKLKRINWSLRVQKTFSKSQTLMIIVQSFRLQRPVNSVAHWFSWPCSR